MLQSGSDSQNRSPGIDVLRGVAVLLVVLHHIHLRFRLNKYDVTEMLPGAVANVAFWSGYYSVIAFFVISGFLITTLSIRRWRSLEKIPLTEFYWLRTTRILPCLLVLLAVLSMLHLVGFADYAIKPERASLARALTAALTFHMNWLEGHRGYLPGNWDVLWSLSVEETFYLLFPIVCLLVRRERWLIYGLIALIVIGPFNRTALGGKAPWDDYAYLSCMDGIAFGCLAALIAQRRPLDRKSARLSMIGGTAAVALIVVLRGPTFDLGLTRVGLNVTLLEMGVALVLIALANGVGNTVLAKRTSVLQLAGRCSYEIYLTHMFVVFVSMQLFKVAIGKTPSVAAFWFAHSAMLGLSVALGVAVARYFSEPINVALRSKALRKDGLLQQDAQ